MLARWGPVAAAALVVAGCTAGVDAPTSAAEAPRPTDARETPSRAQSPSPTPTPTPTSAPTPTESTTPAPEAEVDEDALRDMVDTLSGEIGPREATSGAFADAARFVEQTLTALGYDVTRQSVPVPAGESWGVPVPAGDSANVVAVAPGTDLSQPHLVVGAHLDTVPQAPGAVDNASGVAVLLEVARMATIEPPQQPVVFVAFGAEEPRGPGDDLHHFGSQAYVAAMPEAQRSALTGAIAIDSVGISPDGVPVCTARPGDDPFADAVREAVVLADVPLRMCENRTSDHWSFVRTGLDGVRVGLAGQAEYAQYHSDGDVPAVVADELLGQAAEAVWAAISHRW